jgi:Uncharacterised nucleotidyltransferase
MAHIEPRPDRLLLANVIRHPDRLASMTAQDVSRVLDAAYEARLLGWALAGVDAAGAADVYPDWLRDRILDYRALGRDAERAIRWEIDRLHRAFDDAGVTWLLLKGAAYVAAGLAPGRARQVADIDVLVPEAQLPEAERRLRDRGWNPAELDPYDERYYREWMHELPPFIHQDRGSVVDLHHAILPKTSRLTPSSERLIERAMVVGADRVLCPSHMILHAAAHLFHDGEVAGAIRDLVDIDALVRHFDAEPGFWQDWLTEAPRLGLVRPAYYALRYARQLVGTPVPGDVTSAMTPWGPSASVRALMDRLVTRAISGSAGRLSSASVFGLYVRSHWLRMPAPLLIRHLSRKAMRRA